MRNHYVYALVDGLDVHYVGYTAQLSRRREDHRRLFPSERMLSLGAHPTREIGLQQECWWIRRLFDAGHPLRNKSEGGERTALGIKRSYLTRARLSARMVGNKRMLGHVPSLEHRAKISAVLTGREFSPEHRANISATHKGKLVGRKLPAAHRAKISAALTGRRFSAEHRAKISAAKKGHQLPPLTYEARAKLSAALTGRKLSPEHCAKISASKKEQAKGRKRNSGGQFVELSQ